MAEDPAQPTRHPASAHVPLPPPPAPAAGTIVAGDNFGRVHFLDPRMAAPIACVPLHRKTGKVRFEGWAVRPSNAGFGCCGL